MSTRLTSTICLFCFAFCFATDLTAQKKSQQTQKIDEKTKKELFGAVEKSQHDVVEKLLKQNPELISAAYEVETAFFNAVRVSDSKMVKLFLKYGADSNVKNYYGVTPLHIAYDPEVGKVLIEHGANVNAKLKNGDTPIKSALFYGNAKLAKVLYENGAHADLKTLIAIGQTKKAINLIKQDKPKTKKDTDSFCEATFRGNVKVVQTFLDIGADSNQYIFIVGGTGPGPGFVFSPLCSAVGGNRYKVAELLLKHGADPNFAQNEFLTSAYDYAVFKKNQKIIKLLKKHGGNE